MYNLNNNIDINLLKKFLELNKIDYQDRQDYLIMKTICHNSNPESASLKLYFYKNTGMFMCYTECGAMNIFSFLKKYKEIHHKDNEWYFLSLQQLGLNKKYTLDNFEKQSIINSYDNFTALKNKSEYKHTIYPKSVLNVFSKIYPQEWIEEGITQKAMDKFNIMFSISQNKIIIPHVDEYGNLIGIRGRTLNKEEEKKYGKYMPVMIENKRYNHKLSYNLYGLYQNKQNIIDNNYVFIFEGEKSVLLMEGFKQPNCSVAVCGNKINKNILKQLIKITHPKEIIIAFDNEEIDNEKEYFDYLYSVCYKYRHYCNFSFIYDIYGLTNYKDSPVDKGEEIFNKLVQQRFNLF